MHHGKEDLTGTVSSLCLDIPSVGGGLVPSQNQTLSISKTDNMSYSIVLVIKKFYSEYTFCTNCEESVLLSRGSLKGFAGSSWGT